VPPLQERARAVRLDKLTSRQLDELYRRLLVDGMSPATIKSYHAVLSAALGQAVKWGIITRSVAPMATLPIVDQKRMKVPNVAMIQQQLTYIEAGHAGARIEVVQAVAISMNREHFSTSESRGAIKCAIESMSARLVQVPFECLADEDRKGFSLFLGRLLQPPLQLGGHTSLDLGRHLAGSCERRAAPSEVLMNVIDSASDVVVVDQVSLGVVDLLV
jgi:hypothetical protein